MMLLPRRAVSGSRTRDGYLNTTAMSDLSKRAGEEKKM